MTTEKNYFPVRYSVDGVWQIMHALESNGWIESWKFQNWWIGEVVSLKFASGREFTFTLDWFREEMVKVDPVYAGPGNAYYMILWLSQRFEEFFSAMEKAYQSEFDITPPNTETEV